jgi:hypothetical protein
MKSLSAEDLCRRMARLDDLARRLCLERDRVGTLEFPLHLSERLAYKAALTQAVAGLSAARVALAAAFRRLEGEGKGGG